MNVCQFIKQICTLLKFLRIHNGLSQAEASSKLNVSPRSYQRYENGDAYPPIDLIFKASKFYNVPISIFYSPESQASPSQSFTIYDQQTQKQFLSNEIVNKSKLLELAQKLQLNANWLKFAKSDNFQNQKANFIIKSKDMAILNEAGRNTLGFDSCKLKTPLLYNNPLDAGIFWASWLGSNNRYATYKDHTETPNGTKSIRAHCCMISNKSEDIVIGVFSAEAP